jgi:hypothetical protein
MAKKKFKTEKDAVSFVQEKFDKYREERQPVELDWLLKLNFLSGNQYCQINKENRTIDGERLDYKYEHREVFNRLLSIYQTKLAKLSVIRPAFRVRGATMEWEDQTNARIETAILKGATRQLKFKDKMMQANQWSEALGTAVYMTLWNKQAGTYYGKDDQGEEVYDGEVDCQVITPFGFYPAKQMCDNGMEGQPAVIYACTKTVEELSSEWGVDEKEFKGRKVNIYTLDNAQYSLGHIGSSTTGIRYVTEEQDDSEYQLMYFERPTKEHPKGRLIITAGDVLLHNGPLPYRNGEKDSYDLPFDIQVSERKPGHFWGECSINRCIPVQRHYNKIRNLKIEAMNRTVIGCITAEAGAIDTEEYEREGMPPGTVVEYKRGFQRPMPMQTAPLPNHMETEDYKMQQEFITLSGVSELDQSSTTQAGLESGIALAILKESGDTRIALTAEMYRSTIVNVAKRWLRMYRQFASTDRVTRYIGADDMEFVQKWSASNITSDDVVLETVNELSETPAQRSKKVLDYMNAGFFADPATGTIDKRTLTKLAEIVEIGHWEIMNDVEQLQLKKAERENLMAQQNMPMGPEHVEEFDDHAIHAEEHLRFWLSKDFEILKRSNPELGIQFQAHIKMHQMMQRQTVQPQAPS